MTTKVAVSLPDDVAAAARDAVARGVAPSVSACVARAITALEEQRSLDAVLDELDRLHGEPSQADLDWADRLLRP